ncbi:hypothetical protein [uncultured Eubacterium sp.]|mgnify:CR=1 FL=1|nr:hypothetical protein [uncultured Eubacterium sp.]
MLKGLPEGSPFVVRRDGKACLEVLENITYSIEKRKGYEKSVK